MAGRVASLWFSALLVWFSALLVQSSAQTWNTNPNTNYPNQNQYGGGSQPPYGQSTDRYNQDRYGGSSKGFGNNFVGGGAGNTLAPFMPVYEWFKLDYNWMDEMTKAQALSNRRFIPENNALAGIKTWRDRIFVTIPRWKEGVPVTIASLPAQPLQPNASPRLDPFPNWQMQELGNCTAFQFVQSMEVDTEGRIWILDTGRTNILDGGGAAPSRCPPKLVIIDLNSVQFPQGGQFPNTGFPGQPGYQAPNQQFPGQNPQYPGQNPPYPGQNPQYPAQNPQYPGQNPPYPGQPGYNNPQNTQYPGQTGYNNPNPNPQYPNNPGQPGYNSQYPNSQYPNTPNSQYPNQNSQYPNPNSQYGGRSNQFGPNQPGYNQPGYNQPGYNQPGYNPQYPNQYNNTPRVDQFGNPINQPYPGQTGYPGQPGYNPAFSQPFGLGSNFRIVKSFNFPSNVATPFGNYMNDIVLDNSNGWYAYITDHGDDPGIIVYSFREDRAWKVKDARSMRSDPDVGFLNINNIDVELRGKNIDGIALSPASGFERTLYFSPLGSYNLYSVPTSVLKNPNLPSDVSSSVVDLGRKQSITDGMIMDNRGNLYFGLLGLNAVGVWNTNHGRFTDSQRMFARDTRSLQWPDTFAIDDGGNLWVVTNRLQNYITGRVNLDEPNYRILKAPIGGRSYMAPADLTGANTPYGSGGTTGYNSYDAGYGSSYYYGWNLAPMSKSTTGLILFTTLVAFFLAR